MHKEKYESNLRTRRQTPKMDSRTRKEMYKDNGSKIYGTRGVNLSWVLGTISPNIRGRKEEHKIGHCLEDELGEDIE